MEGLKWVAGEDEVNENLSWIADEIKSQKLFDYEDKSE